MALVAAIGINMAAAAPIDTASTTKAEAKGNRGFHQFAGKFPGKIMMNPFKNLPESVQAELKVAREAKDFAKIEEILKANGLTLPNHMKMHMENSAVKQAFNNLPQAVKDQLKVAREAKDFAKIEEILKANGLEMPAKLNHGMRKIMKLKNNATPVVNQ